MKGIQVANAAKTVTSKSQKRKTKVTKVEKSDPKREVDLSIADGVDTYSSKEKIHLLTKDVPNVLVDFEKWDESALKERLHALEKELHDYREKINRCKSENIRYRQEIENTETDTIGGLHFLP
ncbi:hypothetical protein BKA69DRAFT_126548 [Paraphysoderma sedebokerense]|nr:hypothetical protein BKA69DRAFT_126548 [Paraphysoderma sedebokerense]